MATADLVRLVSFQGQPGAYSDLACRSVFPGVKTLPCRSFEDAFAAVAEGQADRAMIPIENSVAGRVADVYHLMPGSGLHIVAEHFQRVNHQLLAVPGAALTTIKRVYSHVHALGQCRTLIRELKLEPIVAGDTAGAAAEVAARNDPAEAAIASSLAGEIHGLTTLKADIEDAAHNTTRFLVLSRVAEIPDAGDGSCITTFVFRVRNVPAALYKALGGFATNGVNLTKLESYMVGGHFSATEFYADADCHPDERPMRLALEELRFFTREFKVLGVYPASTFRTTGNVG
ncbi:MAG TPA: prephenate dehydratase [Candidatus Sulfotelmatobacter sp.]|nr:prephenate dehydratase [Candidatus Sulfotelmatobacter sp.]